MATAKHFEHFTLEDRKEIENGVVEGRTIKHIAEVLDVDPTSISRELKRNRRCDGKSVSSFTSRTDCLHRKTCKRKHLCNNKCAKKCALCFKGCHKLHCDNYEAEHCKRTTRAPYVCNGCSERHKCPLERWTYSAKAAQAQADSRLVNTRVGIDLTGKEMQLLADTVKAGLKLGQSVHHIFVSRPNLPCTERSFYRYVEAEAIDVRKMDLPKKVKYKKRNKKKISRHEKEFYDGRTYADYLSLEEEKRARTVEIDCVEGIQEDTQAILTLHFISLRFQIYILLKKKDSEHVVAALDWIEFLCGKEAFKKIFGLLLADRGSEFDDIAGIEKDDRCDVYYTDPQRPDQKGGCEKNHVELRKIIPKGTSIDKLKLDAWLVAGICAHANSSLRLAIGDACPMALAKAALPKGLLDGLGLELIAPEKVETKPSLIGHLRAIRDNN